MVEQYGVNQSKLKIKGAGYLQEQYISLADLRKVSGIGDKTIERIKEQLLQNELDGNYKSEYNPNIKLDVNNIYHGDCLDLMNGIPDKSVDMILCDLPYGTTACKWDAIIPFEPLWEQYERVIKDNGAIVLTGNEPFSSHLRLSNLKKYKYDWKWDKVRGSNFATVKIRPFNSFEDVMVFYKKQPTYNPQMWEGKPYEQKQGYVGEAKQTGLKRKSVVTRSDGRRYPLSVIRFSKESGLHPTQKPVALFEYLIKTYTNEGETVLDNCIGSGTTAIACMNTNRNYIGIELDEGYFNITKNRINEHIGNLSV